MKRLIQTFVTLLMLTTSGLAASDSQQAEAVVRSVLSEAASQNADYRRVASLFPTSLVADDYQAIIKALMLNKLDLEQIGGKGVDVKWQAIDHAIYALGSIPKGGPAIIRLWTDKQLRWDGAASLELCDAAVRRGKEMLPLLEKLARKKSAAKP
jgi:hypothetical protein